MKYPIGAWSRSKVRSARRLSRYVILVAFSVAHRQMRLPIPSSIPSTLAKLMSRCWEEDSQSRPEFDVIRELLEAARHEFQDYDKSGEFRSLQVTLRSSKLEIPGIWPVGKILHNFRAISFIILVRQNC